ncbi:MAG: carboxypeptidase-like regulatory domain-containing protein [Terracidiphilus sp.]
MAEARRIWSWALAALLMAAAAGVPLHGQTATRFSSAGSASTNNEIDENGGAIGSIAGRLTDLYSAPLGGATVVVRNEATGAERRTTTARNGSYRFAGLEAGEYSLEAESERLGSGHLDGIVVAAGHEARVQTAIDLQPEVVTPVLNRNRTVEAEAAPVPAVNPLTAMPEREKPTTDSPILVAELMREPMAEMAVSGWRIVDPVLEARAILSPYFHSGDAALVAAVPEITAAIDQEALQGLALPGIGFGGPGAARARVDAADVDPVTPVVTTTMTAEQLQGLPVGGRRWQDFVLDTPTAASAAGGSSQTSLRGAGQQPAQSTVDGASMRLAFGGAGSGTASGSGSEAEPSGMAQAWAGGRGFAPGETAIREVQTVAGNVEAQSARAAGGRMNVETARGMNGLHGQGFLFDRQNVWGAQNPFTQWVKETAPATEITSPTFTAQPYTPPDHEMTWGAGAGSQIKRDKLFWFAALDGYQRNDPGLATVKHPYLCANPPVCTEQAGFFAQPSNDEMQVLSKRLWLSSANPVAEGLSAYSTMLGTLAGLLGPSPRTATQRVGFARLDWQAAERHRFTLEGIGATWNSPGGGLTRVSEAYGSNSFGTSKASEEWLLGRWEAFLTPNLLAVTQGSAGRNILGTHAETPSAFEQTFLSPSIWGQLPQIVVDNRYGFTIGNPSRFGEGSYPDERLYEGQEMLDWVHGNLLMKAGFDLSHNSDATSLLRNQTGTYSYSSVENFASDALVYGAFGMAAELNPFSQHNCDQTGKVWRDSGGGLRGLGYLPCYSYYSQTMGPSDWHLSTNDWAGYATAQWQPKRLFVVSAGLRWEMEQMPPPIAALANPELPLTEKLPSLGNNFGPRISMALGNVEAHWPVLRLGYGMYFGRTENATLETALTQTGSAKGDLNFFMRPTDNLNAGGAPPFPYVFAGEPASMVKPGAVEFAPTFRNPEIHQGVAALEESLPGHVELTASAMVSLGRRLPVTIDTNFAPALNPGTITYRVVDGTGVGPIKSTQIKVPFYASWPLATSPTGFGGRLNPDYQQISQVMSRANSTYEALVVKLSRDARRGLSLHAHYTYAHAVDWNPNESTQVAGSDVLDPTHFSEEYGTSNLDMRHSAAVMAVWQAPWKLHGGAGRLANGWMLSGVGQFRSGLPYTMRTSGSLVKEFDAITGAAIVGLGPGMNGSGGDNRVYGVGRNTYRYPATWKADVRLGKSFDLGAMRKLELLVESFNLFNHQNVTELETTGYYIEPGSLNGAPPTLNFLTGLKANSTAFGQPLNVNATDFYRERQVQVGARVRF